MAWECLSEEEKKEIISLLPSGLVLEDGKPPMEFLKYSTNWGDALRVFQADLEAGRYEPEWLAQAAEAMEERAAGKFDDAKEKHFEEYWGQKAQLESHMLTSEQSKIRLEELVSEGIFKVGDIWSYGRAFGRGKAAVLIEKDIEVSNPLGLSDTLAHICSLSKSQRMKYSSSSLLQGRGSLSPSQEVAINQNLVSLKTIASTR